VAYALGKKPSITIIPSEGNLIAEVPNALKSVGTVLDLVKLFKSEVQENKGNMLVYFCPGISIIDAKILFDQTKSSSFNNAVVAITDKSKFLKN